MSEPYKKPFIPIWMDQAGLTAQQFRVLAHFWSRGEGRCFPSLETIAESVGMKRITVINAIAELEAKGFVTRKKRKSKGIRFANEYVLTGPKGAPVKSEPVPLGHHLTGPKGAPSNRSLWGTGNDTSVNEPSLKETSLFGAEEKPLAELIENDCHEFFQYWQSFKNLPLPRVIDQRRKSKLKTRLKEKFFQQHWREGITKIAASPFMTGQGERGWKADIDWLLSPGNLLKVIEGKYDQQTPSKPPTTVNLGGRQRRNSYDEHPELPE